MDINKKKQNKIKKLLKNKEKIKFKNKELKEQLTKYIAMEKLDNYPINISSIKGSRENYGLFNKDN